MRFVLPAAVLLAVAAPVRADAEQEFVKKVNRAIERGKAWLIQQEAGKGHWENVTGELIDMTGGQTALATLSLLNAGVPPEDKVIQRALDFLRTKTPRTRTYVVGLTTMAFAEARQPQDLPRIQENADWLLENAVKQGGKIAGWSYPRQAPQFPDGSNTQYALLGLYAARQAGAKIPDPAWVQIREFYEATAKPDGPTAAFWGYLPNQSQASLTMTVAGVCGLLIADMGLNKSDQQLDETTGKAARCGFYATSATVAKGLNFVAGRFEFGLGKSGAARPSWLKSTYYNVYGMERLGRLSGQRFIGRYDWYREGCDKLIEAQNPNGSWSKDDSLDASFPSVATSFAVLFLSKGRTPVLLTKFAHGDARVNDGGQLLERGDDPGVVGWNRKKNDARHLTEFASRELFKGVPLGWQVYDARRVSLEKDDLKAEVEGLLASPLMYLNGHQRLVLSGQQKELLKRYVDEGGFLFAEACCGSPEFAAGFAELMKELFPESELVPMPPEHPLWRAFYTVSPADFPGVMMLDRGCKTVVVFSKTPVAGFWEETRFQPKKGEPANTRGERAYQFGGNVVAYATGMQPPEQKGFRVKVADAADASPPRGAFKPAQLKAGENPPAPAAMRNLVAYARDAIGLEATFDVKRTFPPGDAELMKHKFLYLHGRKAFTLTDDELDNLRASLETGGLLFADAACGKKEFDASFRQAMAKLYPEAKLEPIPVDDELFSEKVNGKGNGIRTVKRREKADGTGPDGGYRNLPPALEGIKIDGRWVVIYSKYDIGCSLERRVSTDCLGHTPDSALQLASAAVLYSLKR